MSFYTFLPKLLNMSMTASIAIACVLLLRLLLKKAPKVISYCLWAVVLFRLLCPVSIESDLSLFGLMNAPTANSTSVTSSIEYIPENIVHTEYPQVTIPVPGISEVMNNTLPQGEEQLVADPMEAPVFIGTYIWLVGVLVMAVYSMVSYIQLRKKLLVTSPLHKNIYLADEINTPFVMGLILPKIYIPSDTDKRQLPYIILHEQHHIRRGDHVIKALAFLALSIHWFNPLVWVAFVCANKDMEMSCDEAVIKKMGDDILADYAASLLSLATGKTIIAGMPLAFGEGDTKGRIRNLANWKKPAFWVVLAAIIACTALSIGLLTNPAKEEEHDHNEDGYYLLIQDKGVTTIEVSGPHFGGGVENADGSMFRVGEKVLLEQLQGVVNLRGIRITALGAEGEIIYEFLVSEDATAEIIAEKVSSDPWLLLPENFEVTADNISMDEIVSADENILPAEEFPASEDGSYRLSEYQVDLTGDKNPERIVFDVYYWDDLEAKAEVITEEVLWEELWNHCEVRARVLNGEDGRLLWEYSYSEVHAGNGNLAVIKYDGNSCLMRYGNWIGQGAGSFFYQILKFENVGEEPVILAEKTASYNVPYWGNDETAIAKVLETAEELDRYLTANSTEILVNASISDEQNCYLYGSKQGLLNGVRRQTAFGVFMQEVGGNGWELNLRDYFYPDGMESLTVLPGDAEERIRAGEILCMEVSPDNATAGRLDIDGDGVREVLCLYGVSDWYGGSGWHFYREDYGVIDEKYRIRVDGKYYEGYCDILDPVLMAYSPDGKQILLAVYDDGPSNDPKTSFFKYDTTGVHPAGMITDDLREVTIDENGVIKGTFRADMIQTEWAYGYYIWNDSAMVMREDEVYYLLDDSGWRDTYETPLLLLEEITVYADRSEESKAMIMKPQKVSNVATDRKEWVLLEAEDGTGGWLRVDQGTIPQLGNKRTSEVFEGLNMAD